MNVHATQTASVKYVDPRAMANAIRALSMDAVEAANSGHPGMPMGMADAATALFSRHLKFDPTDPAWPDRDRFILSAGHGSMLLYSLLHLTGYADMTTDELKRFRQLGAKTAGHPEYGHAAGIEMTTGPLGQGIATAVGMALAERLLNARFGDDLVDHYTYVIAGDGCLMEGISHEAIDLAGHLRLSKLIVLFDDNGISIDGHVSLTSSMDQLARFAAASWNVMAVDGHDIDAVDEAIQAAKQSDRPSLIACKTTIGYGSPNKQDTSGVHGSPLGAAEIALTRETLGWTAEPFVVPQDILDAWRTTGARGHAARNAWNVRFEAASEEARAALAPADAMATDGPDTFNAAIMGIKKTFADKKPELATRQSSQKVLEALSSQIPSLLGGSADLTGSVGTKTSAYKPVTATDFSGNYIHYGVREHGMAAAMNGLALHGGFIPYGGTFLAFADYSRPAIRLGALMGVRVIHVMTHDSIGLGEDGPTHQPVEQLSSLRAIPNLNVFRPGDAVEVAEAWAVALSHTNTPSVLSLTRQGLPTLRTTHTEWNKVAKGGYVLAESEGARDVTLMATGSELSIAVDAAAILKERDIEAAVVSLPCWELFSRQSADYRDAVLGTAPRIGIEAALRDGWDRWLGADGDFVGMTGYGASAPAPDLYEHFGITAGAIADKAERAIAKRRHQVR